MHLGVALRLRHTRGLLGPSPGPGLQFPCGYVAGAEGLDAEWLGGGALS